MSCIIALHIFPFITSKDDTSKGTVKLKNMVKAFVYFNFKANLLKISVHSKTFFSLTS